MVTAEDGTTIRYLWIIVTAAPPTPVTAISDISGVAKVGVELTAGTLTPVDATATYQWTICETADGTYTNIVGATTNKYTPVAGDATKFIKVVATGTGSYTGTATSAVTATVAASASLDLTNTTLGGVLVMDDPNSMGETGADESNAIRLKVGLSGSPDYYATAVFVPVTYDNTTVTAYASDGTSGGTYNALAINYNFSGFDPNRVLWVKVVSEDASAICYYRILVLTT
ncbi:MAG: hypothetical protein CVV00_15250 [Firmicutes bacterium HGW-Firmicutes-5]|nr:MAG: hypothetical protein CVV00_15250 [Firmicutes bacterium HGW-Firmicutes-5]